MTKIQEIGDTEAGEEVTSLERGSDFFVGARRTAVSPETWEDIKIPVEVLDDGTIYDFGMSLTGTPTDAFSHRVVLGMDVVIESGFSRSYGWVTTPPAADFEILMKVEGFGSPGDLVDIATITINTSGVYSFDPAPSPADMFIEAKSRVWFVYEAGGTSPPTPDASIVDIDFIIGARVVYDAALALL